MPDIFEDARRALARGQEHARDVETELRQFHESHPYALVDEHDTKNRRIDRHLRVKRPPKRAAELACDAVNNFRMALDRALYAIASSTGALNTSDERYVRDVRFPIEGDRASFEQALGGKYKYLPENVRALLATVEPYARGKGSLLWSLNRIGNINKHRLLVPVRVTDATVATAGFMEAPPLLSAVEDKIAYATQSDRVEPNDGVHVTLNISFDDPEVECPLSLLGFLHEVSHTIEDILNRLEALAVHDGYTRRNRASDR